MPADTLTISLTGPLAADVRAAAQARGLSPEEYIRELAADDAAFEAEYNDLTWDEDYRRLQEPAENVPLDQAFDRLDENVAAERAKVK